MRQVTEEFQALHKTYNTPGAKSATLRSQTDWWPILGNFSMVFVSPLYEDYVLRN